MVAKKSRPRRPAEETRHGLVAEGLRQLEPAGIDFGVEYLILEAACAVNHVPRSSTRASWGIDGDYTPRAPFQRTVLRQGPCRRVYCAAAHAGRRPIVIAKCDEIRV